jgi:hypothetical protein
MPLHTAKMSNTDFQTNGVSAPQNTYSMLSHSFFMQQTGKFTIHLLQRNTDNKQSGAASRQFRQAHEKRHALQVSKKLFG